MVERDGARRYGVSVSDIVRRLIDETRGAYLTPGAARTSEQIEGVTIVGG